MGSRKKRVARTANFLVVAWLVLDGCGSDSNPTSTSDAAADDGRAGAGGMATGDAAEKSPDATEDATSETTSDALAGDAAAPCIVDLDATVNCPPEELPPDDNCPASAPSYTTEVAAVIAAKCTTCHRPGGLEPVNQFDTRAKIVKNNNNIHMLVQVYACRMPQACGEPLTSIERQKLLQWLVCGAPDN